MNTPKSIYSKTVDIALDALAEKDRRIAALEAENSLLRAKLKSIRYALDNEADCSEVDGPNVQSRLLVQFFEQEDSAITIIDGLAHRRLCELVIAKLYPATWRHCEKRAPECTCNSAALAGKEQE